MRGALAAAMVTLVLATGCARATVSSVAADPSAYHGKRITVTGVVASGATVIGRGFYRIDEGGARLWVLTETGMPAPGSHVEVTGRIYNAYDVRGNLPLPAGLANGTVLVESSHRIVD
jgi:hypothetical protein